MNWHATPFEERLMKVLSDEKPHHQRYILLHYIPLLALSADISIRGANMNMMNDCDCARKISGKLIHLEEDAVESPASATASS